MQIRSASGSFVTHFQAQDSGQIRGKLRGELPSENINAGETSWVGPGDQPWPEGEWFHVAQTYDSNATFGGEPGHWIIYYNGQIINQNYANGETDGFPTGAIDLG